MFPAGRVMNCFSSLEKRFTAPRVMKKISRNYLPTDIISSPAGNSLVYICITHSFLNPISQELKKYSNFFIKLTNTSSVSITSVYICGGNY